MKNFYILYKSLSPHYSEYRLWYRWKLDYYTVDIAYSSPHEEIIPLSLAP